ncbi:glycerophosphodiester phosphodiesterase family protein [Echinicola shivajiensis]|uniref:glycerophosphodiester phosphodiesterase family protein n=1 Tax=Echinicola shivajiensis TaxID=1035916 RepID=UPI001BFC1FBF|nr:glycerophosphodiester phosphodiesterase family protein [Echinicola shivajiensis]
MNSLIRLLFVVFIVSVFVKESAYAQKIHKIKLKGAKELHEFFSYKEDGKVLISGHRGGKEEGYPENSIVAFKNTLRYTPAFFEIDPRLTKDSVIVLMHDATIDRTTNGKGKLSDYTWKEVKKLKLVDVTGKVTKYKVPTLEEVIKWSKGKTIVDLDHKDVPMEMTADLIIKLNAFDHVMVTVHKPSQAEYYLERHKDFMFAAFIRNLEELEAYVEADIPWSQVMAYVGPLSKPENKLLYKKLHDRGVMVMVSAASSYDKLDLENERNIAYRKVIEDGADILESDFPIRAAKAVTPLISDGNIRK